VVLAGALAYGNSLSGPFVFDDFGAVVENVRIREWPSVRVLFPAREAPTAGRPLVNASFAINYALGGLEVRGYHIWNLAVHLLCGALVFACVRRTLEWPRVPDRLKPRSLDLAFAVAILWTLHPLNSEVVDYVTERTESMMALFYLLTIYGSARAIGSSHAGVWQGMAVVSCGMGMACKESMVTAPVMVVLYDRTFVFGSLTQAFRRRWRFYAGLAATWLALAALLQAGPRVHSAGFSAGVSPWTYALNQTVMIARYLRLAVWPNSLVINYGWPRPLTLGDVLPYALVIMALVLIALIALRRQPTLGFLGAWFFITLAPTSSIVPIATEVGAERRMYLPLAAIVTLAVIGVMWSTDRLKRHRAITLALLIVVGAVLTAGTVARNREYRSALGMAETVLERWPSAVAESMLGLELAIAGRHDEAMAHLRAATSGYPGAHHHLGGELFNAGRLDEAIAELETFVQQEPLAIEAVSARTMLGQAFMSQMKWPQAVEQLRLVLSMTAPRSAAHTTAIGLLADSLFGEEQYDDAITYYRTYLSSRPADVGGETNLGISLVAIGKVDDALAAFRRATDVGPRDVRARRNLAMALFDRGDLDGARIEFERAVQLDPDDVQTRKDLDEVLQALRAKARR